MILQPLTLQGTIDFVQTYILKGSLTPGDTTQRDLEQFYLLGNLTNSEFGTLFSQLVENETIAAHRFQILSPKRIAYYYQDELQEVLPDIETQFRRVKEAPENTVSMGEREDDTIILEAYLEEFGFIWDSVNDQYISKTIQPILFLGNGTLTSQPISFVFKSKDVLEKYTRLPSIDGGFQYQKVKCVRKSPVEYEIV